MHKSAKKTNQAHNTVYDQVIHTALHLFTKQGYFNTSIPDIVHSSGCSTGSIYHHFKDKEGIASALYENLLERMNSSLDEIEQKHPTSKLRCRAVIELLFHLTETEPEVMEFILYAKHKEFLPGKRPICSSKPFQKMREFVVLGVDKGEFYPMDDLIAASSLYGGALRMIYLRLDGVLNYSLMDKLEEVWKCAWRSVAIQ
ncbi:TetR/AcrR family transcriptional regulator [sulfur-oxidizing endosymbiont of Gigantopelta aegis]|uniref:TetR/AcrR family transcriptional regulator n=1 Tax=sulfur-oxidizing endosymbiont of Gigantopelta aegis TaxID=2794934 RepID=UPI0018DB66AC|nr:TetR/AcrR family transcriptional regulator [sulfur-oxidizing endosymbiont of Gigantopelta aegis]